MTDIVSNQTFREYALLASDASYQGAFYVSLFGSHPSVPITGESELLWNPGIPYIWQTEEETITIVSTEAEDKAIGTGARLLRVRGVSKAGNWLQEDILLDGLTPVITTKKFFRVHLAVVIAAGVTNAQNYNTNLGKITLTGTDSSDIHAEVNPLDGVSKGVLTTVPINYTGYLLDFTMSVEKTGRVSPAINVKLANGVNISYNGAKVMEGDFGLNFRGGESLPSQTDISIYVSAQGPAVCCSGNLQVLMVRDKSPIPKTNEGGFLLPSVEEDMSRGVFITL